MQNSSAFQYLAIDTIHESTTNPRRTFDEVKLQELADSIRQHGLIQPITVRPNNEGFEIVAGARRYRASLLAEQFSIPSRIVELTDAQSPEWALVENSQRVDVHPYEEAQGLQQLLDIPGYDVAALVDLVTLDPYTFADDVAEHFATEDENNDKSAEEILLATVDGLTDDKLTGFALRLVLTGDIPIPREGEVDSLTEAETAFVPAKPKKTATKTAKAPTQIEAAQKTASKKSTGKKQVAA
jgi:ParB-like chromosome segregation protein Spo0J